MKVFICVLISLTFVEFGRGGYNVKDIRFDKALGIVHEIIRNISTTWDIKNFPNFLQTCYMPERSWQLMVLKFKQKVAHSLLANSRENLIISFMGSSVTAGHDSQLVDAFPTLLENIIKPAFVPFNIQVIVRNRAMGNNPCFPYDICPKTFAGDDADIIHWEQSYNCGFSGAHASTLEQFIRQSLSLSRKPIVVFSDSNTPNW